VAEEVSVGSSRRPERGLKSAEASRRLISDGPNTVAAGGRRATLAILAAQFSSPLVVLLLGASGVAFAVGERVEVAVIIFMVLLSAALGFVQEERSEAAVHALQQRVALATKTLRDAVWTRVPISDLVRGDVIEVSAGEVVPADARLLEANHLFVDESALTGESAPTQKAPVGMDTEPADAPAGLQREDSRTGCIYAGTSVVGGIGKALVEGTGSGTEYGAIAARLAERAPETDFQQGVRDFGLLIARTTLALVVAVLAVNVALGRPLVESLLFAIALAVGLTPELLPAVIAVNLSGGARALAAHGVIVKRLPAVQNLGAMTVLCTDKTGTITEGRLKVEAAVDVGGEPDAEVLRLAAINSRLQSGFQNPLDTAIAGATDPEGGEEWDKIAELPFDFRRRCVSVLARRADSAALLISKGAPEAIADRSTRARVHGGQVELTATVRAGLARLIAERAAAGYRSVAVATRSTSGMTKLEDADECDLVLEGVLFFSDPPKEGIGRTIERLRQQGVTLRLVTGDDERVAEEVARRVGLDIQGTVTGDELHELSPTALAARVRRTTIFARVDPEQKLRIVHALRQGGAVVGFVGDGINDAPPLHAADVGISVDNATQVARAAADFILLRPGLDAICQGVGEGRRTFANTLKYIRMGTSSNFGNMFSMAAATLFLPFLPMLPGQILLNNLLYDLSQTSIPTDSVDPEILDTPARWDVGQIRRFMFTFGPVSSIFDFLTFFVLLAVLHAGEAEFHTGWFVESLGTQVLVIFVIRTWRIPFWRSRPGPILVGAALGAVVVAALLPYTPVAGLLGFVALPPLFWILLAALAVAYLGLVELVKRRVIGGFGPAGGRAPLMAEGAPGWTPAGGR
jgi:Mg2+-importing ATPase